MFRRFFVIFLAHFVIVAAVNVPNVFAVTSPDFPACTNPQGSIRSSYNDGVHGVVGNSAEFKGKDSVYNVNDSQVLQCLCTDDELGIQTNWWKISSLNDSEIQALKNLGWYYVPNGALWGLDNAAYMAKNSDYACGGGIGGGEVLGLAITGNVARWFYALIGIGSILLFLGFILHRKRNSDMRSE